MKVVNEVKIVTQIRNIILQKAMIPKTVIDQDNPEHIAQVVTLLLFNEQRGLGITFQVDHEFDILDSKYCTEAHIITKVHDVEIKYKGSLSDFVTDVVTEVVEYSQAHSRHILLV